MFYRIREDRKTGHHGWVACRISKISLDVPQGTEIIKRKSFILVKPLIYLLNKIVKFELIQMRIVGHLTTEIQVSFQNSKPIEREY